MSHIYLVRHLPTKLTGTGVYMGRSLDLPILKRQNQRFRKRLRQLILEPERKKASLATSPLLRCRQTARVIAEELKLSTPFLVLEEFTETNYGQLEGKSNQQIKTEFPKLYKTWISNPAQVTFPGGESFQEVQERAYQKLLDLIKGTSKKELFVVTHVDVIKLIVCKLLSIPIDKKRLFDVETGSITCLESSNKEIRLKFLNLT